jgi:hypothetical protein
LISRLRDANDKNVVPEIEEIGRNCKPTDRSVALNFAMARAFAFGGFQCLESAKNRRSRRTGTR